MATINKKLIHFRSLSDFEARLAAGDVLSTSIVWIKDAKKIWTHGEYYDCNGGGEPTLPAYAEYTGTATAVVVTTKYGYFPDTLVEGARVAVKFEGSLTYITSLNVNDTGAKNVYYKGNSLTSGMINRYNTYDFIFDGSYWRIIGVNTDTDTHYTAKNIVGASTTAKANAAATNGNVHLNLVENSTVRSTHNIKGENGVEVTSDASGNITISGSGSGGGDITVDDTLNANSTNPVQNKAIVTALNSIAEVSNSAVQPDDLATVATSGSYNDLSDKPTIPSGTITGVSANGTSVATSGVANIPAASTSKYGVTKLSSATNSTSTSLAATPSAVKAAYDLANGKVSESDIFDNKTDGIIKAEALYNDKSQGGLIYALPTSRLALEDNCDDVLVVRSEIFAGSPEQSMLKADAFYETTTGTIYGLPTSSIVTNGAEDEIIATQSYVDNAVANAGGGGGSYVPMPETVVYVGGEFERTLSPNSSFCGLLVAPGNVKIHLQQPGAINVVNEYTMIFRTYADGNEVAITIICDGYAGDGNITWVNDNPPVFDNSAEEIIEISVKCMYDGFNSRYYYLGTWAKYSV